MTTLVFDLESDGLLKKLSRIHVLAMVDVDANQLYVYRHNETENTIAEGIARLEAAKVIVGHNSVAFDVPALKKVYPTFAPPSQLDTLVMCRVGAPDIKQGDFRLWKQDLLPGKLIGSHSLEAWGHRLNMHKGDYMKDMQAKGLDPWAAWNQEMEDYCINDVLLTVQLYRLVAEQGIPEKCLALEHDIQAKTAKMEDNGFPFDVAEASKLAQVVGAETEKLRAHLTEKYKKKIKPEKKRWIAPAWEAPVAKPKEYAEPYDGKGNRPDYGEDRSRKWWADVTVPKRDRCVVSKITGDLLQYSTDAPYCKIEWMDFNPGSRQQIVDRLVDEGWTPTEFTDTGQPSTDDATLKVLAETNPAAKEIAEYLFLQKLQGQIATGAQSWLNNFNPDTGCVHPYTNCGGTVTGRCSHSGPNIAQVPGVLVGKDKKPKLGREGEFGWECRSLFRVPEHWVEVGIDLSGIEFRALAHLTAEFDGGELVNVVLTGDVHQFNMDKTGIPSRDIVKRVLYGLLYGAGDLKLGLTAKPTAGDAEARMIGARLRAQLMAGLPALKKAIDKVQKEARRGYLIGLDGRKLHVRSEHSALNTRLQSDAALIAKKWVCLLDEYAQAESWYHGWNDGEYLGDYAMMAFVHDEIASAVNPDIADRYAELGIKAAKDAGEFFNFRCPVGAEAKKGRSWAETH